MPTETQVISWLSNNWPSVALGLSAATIYIAAYLRLQTFLGRVDKLEKETIRQGKEINHLKIKISKLTMTHCKLNPEDMENLMKIDEDNE